MKRIINILTNFPAAVFQRDVIAGARDVIAARGYEAAVIQVTTPLRGAADLLLDRQRSAGVLVIAHVLPDEILFELDNRGLPLSLISHQLADGRIPCVMTNNRQGIAMLMEHLVVACRCHQPVFIRGVMDQNDSLQRDTAFRQEVMRYNLKVPPEFYLRGDFDPEIAAASMAQFLASDPDFDAVVAADYLMAQAAMAVIKASGRTIPDEIALVGFGDGPEAAQAGITTVAADVTELGRRGARQLIGQIDGLRVRGVTMLSTELIERETTRSQTQITG
jgi:DNA-binding LacI/PurR family transcriptional regulator